MKTAKYNIGDFVIHEKLGYRAVIVDIDPLFQASGRPNPQVFKRGFATRFPWYRLLVDNTSQITYVEECLLKKDELKEPIENPQWRDYLQEKNGEYTRQGPTH